MNSVVKTTWASFKNAKMKCEAVLSRKLRTRKQNLNKKNKR